MIEEKWLPVVGYEGLYEVSNTGKVKKINKKRKDRILNPYITKFGYFRVGLTKNNHIIQYFVHRLVASAFIPNTYNKPYINHIDNVRTNNNVNNIEWCTPKENMRHAFITGSRGGGEKATHAKLKKEDALAIKESKLSQKVLAHKYKVHATTVSDIQKGKTWANLQAQIKELER